MTIIPAMDIIDGKCVRLVQGNYDAMTIYDSDPVDMAKRFQDHGVQYLHLVDLDGARRGHVVNLGVLESIAKATELKIDFGGGIRNNADVQAAFKCGADKVVMGSVAITNQPLVVDWQYIYGAEKFIVGTDCRNRQLAINGWMENTAIDVISFVRNYRALGAVDFMCTDIGHDGMLEGPSISLYREILSACDINLIASGGVRSLQDLDALDAIGCSGAIIGKAIYEGFIKLKELQNYVETKSNSMP